jgi:hypothetical protein
VIGALLAARAASARHRVRSARWAFLEVLALAGVLAAAAVYQGHALTLELLGRAGGPLAAWPVWREWVYLGVALQCLFVGYVAMEVLLRPADGPILLALPVGPGPRYSIALVDAFVRCSPAPLLLIAFVAPAGALGMEVALVRAMALILASYGVALACGLGVAALAGRVAASPRGLALKELFAGGWVVPARAPYLYAPAVGGGLAALWAVPLQVSLDDWPGDPVAVWVGLSLVLVAAVAVLGAGGWAYARGFARLAPTLETLDARYPLAPRAGDETAVYGLALVGRWRGLAGAVAERDLRSLRRRHRSEPVFLLLLGIAVSLVLWRTGGSPRAAEVTAVALALFAARSGVRLGEADVEVAWLSRVLPVNWPSLLGAKAVLALFLAAHALVPFALGMLLLDRSGAAALGMATTALACMLGPALAIACGGRPGLARGMYLPLSGGLALAALAEPWLALAGLAGLALVAIHRAGRTLRRGTR